ncbi:MAG: hypothetical protein ACFFCW_05455 [Candidatus Hodarchaeota archaeon]
MVKNINPLLGERSESEGQVLTLNIGISFAVLALIKRKQVIHVQIMQPNENTLRIYCQPSLNNNENQTIRKFLETALNVHVNIKRDPGQNFIDFKIG